MDQKRLKQLLKYNPETGRFTDLRTGRVYLGVTGEGYRQIWLDGHQYRGGRLAWLYVYGVWPDPIIDHINGNVEDDRLCNLRVATISQNGANRKCQKTLPKGVSIEAREKYSHNPYKAQIMCKGVRYFLGHFETIEEAKAAYDCKQSELFGEFAKP